MANPIARADSILIGSSGAVRSASPLEEEVVRLFDELRGPVLRYLLAIGLSLQDGEEIGQETFLALFQHLRAGKSRQNLRGWVFRVAHNLGLKRREAAKRAGCAEELGASDPSPNPEAQFASAERQARLIRVLSALPWQDRECLHLRAEGLRYREIAGVLGMSLGAVSISLTRSVARLARADGGDLHGL